MATALIATRANNIETRRKNYEQKKKKALLVASLFLLVLLFVVLPGEATTPPPVEDSQPVILRGLVLEVENLERDEAMQAFVQLEQMVTVEITSEPFKGQQLKLLNSLMGHPLFDLYLTEGQRVIVWGEVDEEGELGAIYLQDRVRDKYLYLIGALFALVLLVVGGAKGLITVVTLGITVVAVAQILLPLIVRGYPPIPITLLVAAGIAVVTLVGIGGLQRKTAAAAIGTVGGVLVAGILAFWFGDAASLTGFSSEEAQMLLYMEGGPIDIRGLLFAGIIIGALGAVMDVAMSIAAASHEVYCANPSICMRDQIKSAMNVGRDVMGTMANTLILAYVGTAAPLLILFMSYDAPFLTVINSDLIATEVVRALAGSIGLIAAIPLTAVSAGVLTVRKTKLPGKD